MEYEGILRKALSGRVLSVGMSGEPRFRIRNPLRPVFAGFSTFRKARDDSELP